MSLKTRITFIQAINNCLRQSMSKDKNVICYGLGINDPKRIFGSTKGLVEKFGNDRVFDIPTSENALMGVAIGLGMRGIKTIYMHQRLDFFLLAMDQLINGAPKWHFMFGGKVSLPITLRLIMGRGWGQGPTHSQNLHAWFSHIPGLKVVMPSNPHDAKDCFIVLYLIQIQWYFSNTVGYIIPQVLFQNELIQSLLAKLI